MPLYPPYSSPFSGHQGRILRVGKGLACPFRQISDAISASQPYDRIEIESGDYYESISIVHPLEVCSSKDDESPVIVARGPCVTVNDLGPILIEGLRVIAKGSKQADSMSVLVVHGSPLIRNCVLSAVHISNDSTPVIQYCKVEHADFGCGIRISDTGGGEIAYNSIAFHPEECLRVHTGGSVNIHNNTFLQKEQHRAIVMIAGIDGGKPSENNIFFCDNIVSGNGEATVEQHLDPVLALTSQQLISGDVYSPESLVHICWGVKPIIRGNYLCNGLHGFLFGGIKLPEDNFTDNRISACRGWAVAIRENTALTMLRCDIQKCAGAIRVVSNTIKASPHGIHSSGSGASRCVSQASSMAASNIGTSSKRRLSCMTPGVFSADEALDTDTEAPTENTNLVPTVMRGISLRTSASRRPVTPLPPPHEMKELFCTEMYNALFRRSQLEAAALGAARQSRRATIRSASAFIRDNPFFKQGESVNIRECTFRRIHHYAVYLENCVVQLLGCSFVENRFGLVLSGNCSGCQLSENKFEANAAAAILCIRESRATLSGNTISGGDVVEIQRNFRKKADDDEGRTTEERYCGSHKPGEGNPCVSAYGVCVADRSYIKLCGNTISGNNTNIIARRGSLIQVEDNNLRQAKFSHLTLVRDSQAIVCNNTLSESERHAMMITRNARAIVVQNSFQVTGDAGLCTRRTSHVELRDNTFHACTRALLVQRAGKLHAEDNKFSLGNYSVVVEGDCSECTIVRCQFYTTTSSFIKASGMCMVACRANKFDSCLGTSLIFSSGAEAMIEKCSMVETKKGFVQVDGAVLMMRACTLDHSKGYGVSTIGESSGSIRECDVKRCSYAAISLGDHSDFTVSETNITGCEGIGIEVFGGSTIRSNRVDGWDPTAEENTLIGIKASGTSSATLSCNSLLDCHFGIVLEQDAAVVVQNSTITSSVNAAIMVHGSAAGSHFTGVKIEGSDAVGVHLQNGAACSFSDCTVDDVGTHSLTLVGAGAAHFTHCVLTSSSACEVLADMHYTLPIVMNSVLVRKLRKLLSEEHVQRTFRSSLTSTHCLTVCHSNSSERDGPAALQQTHKKKFSSTLPGSSHGIRSGSMGKSTGCTCLVDCVVGTDSTQQGVVCRSGSVSLSHCRVVASLSCEDNPRANAHPRQKLKRRLHAAGTGGLLSAAVGATLPGASSTGTSTVAARLSIGAAGISTPSGALTHTSSASSMTYDYKYTDGAANTGVGVYVADGGRLTMDQCQVEECALAAYMVEPLAQASVSNCTVAKCKVGLLFIATPSIAASAATSRPQSARLVPTLNKIDTCPSRFSSLTVQDCTFAAAHYLTGSCALMESSLVRRCEVGVRGDHGATILMVRSKIEDCRSHGIHLHGRPSAYSQFHGVRVSLCSGHGIWQDAGVGGGAFAVKPIMNIAMPSVLVSPMETPTLNASPSAVHSVPPAAAATAQSLRHDASMPSLDDAMAQCISFHGCEVCDNAEGGAHLEADVCLADCLFRGNGDVGLHTAGSAVCVMLYQCHFTTGDDITSTFAADDVVPSSEDGVSVPTHDKKRVGGSYGEVVHVRVEGGASIALAHCVTERGSTGLALVGAAACRLEHCVLQGHSRAAITLAFGGATLVMVSTASPYSYMTPWTEGGRETSEGKVVDPVTRASPKATMNRVHFSPNDMKGFDTPLQGIRMTSPSPGFPPLPISSNMAVDSTPSGLAAGGSQIVTHCHFLSTTFEDCATGLLVEEKPGMEATGTALVASSMMMAPHLPSQQATPLLTPASTTTAAGIHRRSVASRPPALVSTSSAYTAVFDRCSFTNCSTSHVTLKERCISALFARCFFSCSPVAIELPPAPVLNADQVKIRQCEFQACDTGVRVASGTHVRVMECNFLGNREYAVSVRGGFDVELERNTFSGHRGPAAVLLAPSIASLEVGTLRAQLEKTKQNTYAAVREWRDRIAAAASSSPQWVVMGCTFSHDARSIVALSSGHLPTVMTPSLIVRDNHFSGSTVAVTCRQLEADRELWQAEVSALAPVPVSVLREADGDAGGQEEAAFQRQERESNIDTVDSMPSSSSSRERVDRCSTSSGAGLVDADVALLANIFKGCEVGCEVLGHVRPQLWRNQFYASVRGGLVVSGEGARPIVVENCFEEHGAVTPNAERKDGRADRNALEVLLDVTEETLRVMERQAAVRVRDSGGGHFSCNVWRCNQMALYLDDAEASSMRNAVTVTDNYFLCNRNALRASGACRARVINNVFTGGTLHDVSLSTIGGIDTAASVAAGGGFAAIAQPTGVLLAYNRFGSLSVPCAVRLHTEASVSLYRNIFSSNAHVAVYIAPRCVVYARECLFFGVDTALRAEADALCHISRCRFVQHAEAAVLAHQGSAVYATQCAFVAYPDHRTVVHSDESSGCYEYCTFYAPMKWSGPADPVFEVSAAQVSMQCCYFQGKMQALHLESKSDASVTACGFLGPDVGVLVRSYNKNVVLDQNIFWANRLAAVRLMEQCTGEIKGNAMPSGGIVAFGAHAVEITNEIALAQSPFSEPTTITIPENEEFVLQLYAAAVGDAPAWAAIVAPPAALVEVDGGGLTREASGQEQLGEGSGNAEDCNAGGEAQKYSGKQQREGQQRGTGGSHAFEKLQEAYGGEASMDASRKAAATQNVLSSKASSQTVINKAAKKQQQQQQQQQQGQKKKNVLQPPPPPRARLIEDTEAIREVDAGELLRQAKKALEQLQEWHECENEACATYNPLLPRSVSDNRKNSTAQTQDNTTETAASPKVAVMTLIDALRQRRKKQLGEEKSTFGHAPPSSSVAVRDEYETYTSPFSVDQQSSTFRGGASTRSDVASSQGWAMGMSIRKRGSTRPMSTHTAEDGDNAGEGSGGGPARSQKTWNPHFSRVKRPTEYASSASIEAAAAQLSEKRQRRRRHPLLSTNLQYQVCEMQYLKPPLKSLRTYVLQRENKVNGFDIIPSSSMRERFPSYAKQLYFLTDNIGFDLFYGEFCLRTEEYCAPYTPHSTVPEEEEAETKSQHSNENEAYHNYVDWSWFQGGDDALDSQNRSGGLSLVSLYAVECEDPKSVPSSPHSTELPGNKAGGTRRVGRVRSMKLASKTSSGRGEDTVSPAAVDAIDGDDAKRIENHEKGIKGGKNPVASTVRKKKNKSTAEGSSKKVGQDAKTKGEANNKNKDKKKKKKKMKKIPSSSGTDLMQLLLAARKRARPEEKSVAAKGKGVLAGEESNLVHITIDETPLPLDNSSSKHNKEAPLSLNDQMKKGKSSLSSDVRMKSRNVSSPPDESTHISEASLSCSSRNHVSEAPLPHDDLKQVHEVSLLFDDSAHASEALPLFSSQNHESEVPPSCTARAHNSGALVPPNSGKQDGGEPRKSLSKFGGSSIHNLAPMLQSVTSLLELQLDENAAIMASRDHSYHHHHKKLRNQQRYQMESPSAHNESTSSMAFNGSLRQSHQETAAFSSTHRSSNLGQNDSETVRPSRRSSFFSSIGTAATSVKRESSGNASVSGQQQQTDFQRKKRSKFTEGLPPLSPHRVSKRIEKYSTSLLSPNGITANAPREPSTINEGIISSSGSVSDNIGGVSGDDDRGHGSESAEQPTISTTLSLEEDNSFHSSWTSDHVQGSARSHLPTDQQGTAHEEGRVATSPLPQMAISALRRANPRRSPELVSPFAEEFAPPHTPPLRQPSQEPTMSATLSKWHQERMAWSAKQRELQQQQLLLSSTSSSTMATQEQSPDHGEGHGRKLMEDEDVFGMADLQFAQTLEDVIEILHELACKRAEAGGPLDTHSIEAVLDCTHLDFFVRSRVHYSCDHNNSRSGSAATTASRSRMSTRDGKDRSKTRGRLGEGVHVPFLSEVVRSATGAERVEQGKEDVEETVVYIRLGNAKVSSDHDGDKDAVRSKARGKVVAPYLAIVMREGRMELKLATVELPLWSISDTSKGHRACQGYKVLRSCCSAASLQQLLEQRQAEQEYSPILIHGDASDNLQGSLPYASRTTDGALDFTRAEKKTPVPPRALTFDELKERLAASTAANTAAAGRASAAAVVHPVADSAGVSYAFIKQNGGRRGPAAPSHRPLHHFKRRPKPAAAAPFNPAKPEETTPFSESSRPLTYTTRLKLE